MFGLLDRDINYIKVALGKFEEIERAVVFGSRSMGNYKKGSDIDLAVIGENITKDTIFQLNEYLNEEYPIPYFFDLINYSQINNEKLIHHINYMGKEIYKKA